MSKNTHKRIRHANSALDDQEKIERIIADITAERMAASAQLSTQSRAIALGVLAVVWLLLGGKEEALSNRFASLVDPLLGVAAACVFSLIADFLQYVFTLLETKYALDDSHAATNVEEAGYDDPSWLRKLGTLCFFLKLASSLVAASWLLYLIFSALKAGAPT